MDQTAAHWKKSFWAKLIAACFIGLVIVGNIWLVQRFSMDTPPYWIQAAFVFFTGGAFVCGAALLAEQLLAKVMKADERDNDQPQI